MKMKRIRGQLNILSVITIIAIISGVTSVRITNLKVPPTYTLDHEKSSQTITLDCEYVLEDQEKGFVLKWFLNSNCIYQWIPSVKGFALGPMRSKIVINNEPPDQNPGYITIANPDWTMTGDYTCLVQTFESTDKKSSRMQIIIPESNFSLKTKLNTGENKVEVMCNVQNVFPEPILTILLNTEKLVGVLTKVDKDTDGLFNVNVKTEISREKLVHPTPITCIYFLSGTNYTKRKETIFYDHQTISTTVEPNKEEISSAISRLEAEKGSDVGSCFQSKWPIVAVSLFLVTLAFTS